MYETEAFLTDTQRLNKLACESTGDIHRTGTTTDPIDFYDDEKLPLYQNDKQKGIKM